MIRVLLGQEAPGEGTVAHGTKLEISYFDQLREALDDDKTVFDNVADGNEYVTVNGQRKHVIGYLEEFLFAPERSRSPVRVLSGGERSRLLLARLFARPSNVLVLDEPTNDLDLETLELIEDLLVEYSGTVLLVSHDREFLNEVATSTLVFEGRRRGARISGRLRRLGEAAQGGGRGRADPRRTGETRRGQSAQAVQPGAQGIAGDPGPHHRAGVRTGRTARRGWPIPTSTKARRRTSRPRRPAWRRFRPSWTASTPAGASWNPIEPCI